MRGREQGKGERRFEELRRRTALTAASLTRSLDALTKVKGVVQRMTPYSHARASRDWSVYRGSAIEPVVRAAIERMLPDERFGDAHRVGSWWDRRGRQIDLVGLSTDEKPKRVSFVGSIKWRERSPFNSRDLRALSDAATAMRGVDPSTLLVGVSRSGFDSKATGLDVGLTADDLLRSWQTSGAAVRGSP